jgi:hypothetical protein
MAGHRAPDGGSWRAADGEMVLMFRLVRPMCCRSTIWASGDSSGCTDGGRADAAAVARHGSGGALIDRGVLVLVARAGIPT